MIKIEKKKKNNLEALRDRLPVRYSMYWTNSTAESSSVWTDLTIPYLTLPYLILPYLTLPYLTLPYPTWPDLTIPTIPYFILPYFTWIIFPVRECAVSPLLDVPEGPGVFGRSKVRGYCIMYTEVWNQERERNSQNKIWSHKIRETKPRLYQIWYGKIKYDTVRLGMIR